MSLPHWNLDEIYTGCNSDDFNFAINACRENCTRVKALVKDNGAIEEVIKTWEKVLDTFETLDAYTSVLLSVETNNTDYLYALNRVSKLSLTVNNLEVIVINFLADNRTAVLNALDNELKEYSYVIKELLEKHNHLKSQEVEAVAADLNRSGTEAFERLQEALISRTVIEYKGEMKTVTELRNMAFSKEREIRKEAFEKEVQLLKNNEIAYAAALNGVKGSTITLDELHSYEPLKRSLIQSRIDEKIINSLISTLEKNLPLFRKYLNKKAEMLNLDHLAFYDIFAPIGEDVKRYEFEDAKDFILDKFYGFSKEMGDFAKKAFDNNWIDAEPRKNKVGGAYDVGFPDAGVSRILCNFDYSYNGLSTLAHELGHAYHDSVVLPKSHLLRTYPMTLAETASIFSETIVLQGALERASESEKISLIETFLQDTTQVCVDILCRFYFEREVFEKRKESELSSEEFCQIMVESQKKTYGTLSEYHPFMWAVKGHYYSSAFSFYNYPYAFGQLFALGVFAQKQKLGDAFAPKYRKMLENTGKDSAKNVASLLDCDIESEEFWQSSIDIVATYVEDFVNASNN
ncbi:MAG: M3 family oligoendopeptidase [Sphaerochaetaceae bacterium]|nr:M3 family oligoendopeptidase [Sphaerochaetaceae bacterium]